MRVAVVGQEIDVWVLGRTRVRLNVGESSALSIDVSPCALTPVLTPLVSLEPSTTKALLLKTSTEVSIAPKVRSKYKTVANGLEPKGTDKTSGVPNGTGHAAPAPEKAKVPRQARTLRLLPQRFLGDSSLPPNSLDDDLAYVSYKTLLSLYPHGAPPQLHGWRATVRRVAPPPNPDKEATPASPILQPSARVLVPSGEGAPLKGPQPVTETKKNEIVVIWSPEVPVPDGHIVLHPVVDNAEDWDLMRYVRIARSKGCK